MIVIDVPAHHAKHRELAQKLQQLLIKRPETHPHFHAVNGEPTAYPYDHPFNLKG